MYLRLRWLGGDPPLLDFTVLCSTCQPVIFESVDLPLGAPIACTTIPNVPLPSSSPIKNKQWRCWDMVLGNAAEVAAVYVGPQIGDGSSTFICDAQKRRAASPCIILSQKQWLRTRIWRSKPLFMETTISNVLIELSMLDSSGKWHGKIILHFLQRLNTSAKPSYWLLAEDCLWGSRAEKVHYSSCKNIVDNVKRSSSKSSFLTTKCVSDESLTQQRQSWTEVRGGMIHCYCILEGKGGESRAVTSGKTCGKKSPRLTSVAC